MFLRLILAALILAHTLAPPLRAQPHQAGFARQTSADGTELGIWYPTTGTPARQRLGLHMQDVVDGGRIAAGRHPLVVISHGTGGDLSGHLDTAVALARAGFIVAALTHPGDNWRDNSRATQVEARPAALSALITHLLDRWSGRSAIDARRIGAFGFSAGGFTVLTAAGGRPDLRRLADHCARHPTLFDCTLLKAQPRAGPGAWPPTHDRRIRAIVVAAPALGFAFGRAGLAGVTVPVQLWRADADTILPPPLYADAVRAALPSPPEFHTVPAAGHFDFLAPCTDPAAAPLMLCASAPGFDREAFHTRLNAAVVRFFQRRL